MEKYLKTLLYKNLPMLIYEIYYSNKLIMGETEAINEIEAVIVETMDRLKGKVKAGDIYCVVNLEEEKVTEKSAT